jgi:glycosyltransferase involved in cell wall biosynthesis
VIVSDAGGLPEVVRNGETGLIVPRNDPNRLADALCHLIERPVLRDEFGRNGRRLVQQRYEWQHCVDQTIALYEQLLTQRRPCRAASEASRTALP